MNETYREMRARHMRETWQLSQALRYAPAKLRKMELRAIARRHHMEIMEAWRDEQDGETFVYDMMLDGAFYGLELNDILEADNVILRTPEDRERARRIYSMALAYYEEHPNGLGGIA